MPTRYAPDKVFDPQTAEAMREAFEAAWALVEVSGDPKLLDGKAEWAREILALRIIDKAQEGERDSIKLRNDALTFLAKQIPA
jgi:hypothetical protein